MSSSGPDQQLQAEQNTILHLHRKRLFPSDNSRKESITATSATIVGSISAKIRKTSAVNNQVAESNNLNRGSSQEPGSSRTGEGQLANRLSQAIPVKAELRYLTDFFPDQGSSDRRLTRSQTLYSSPSSSAVVTRETAQDCSQNCISPQTRFRTKKKHSRLSHKEAEKSSRSQAQPGYQVLQAATSSNEQFSARAKSQNLVISEAVSSAESGSRNTFNFTNSAQASSEFRQSYYSPLFDRHSQGTIEYQVCSYKFRWDEFSLEANDEWSFIIPLPIR
ncbi:unnamed protein product [Dracunculus medinensis]|uniref:Uncharacterized protein n=1 Tax=Dracunculus medinensis TaxID=318479 RepID=A0A158Q5M4_DRAME|nr:unnamed protein product [Dracunculus medinensis]